MKNYILILFAAICLIGCDSSEDPEVIADKPTVTDTRFFCAMSGTNSSQAVDVTVNIPSQGSVISLSLFTKEGVEVNSYANPISGKYTFYNHAKDCDGRFAAASYHFVFTRADGTKVITEGYPK